MTSGSAKTIFWVGTLSSALIFIALTVDFHRREPEFAHNERITDQVVRGKKIWHKYNCNDCHTILGFGGYYAPDMTKAYYRLGEGNIIHVVMNPEKVYKNSFRKMPKLGVTRGGGEGPRGLPEVDGRDREPQVAAAGREVRQGGARQGGPGAGGAAHRPRARLLRRVPQLRRTRGGTSPATSRTWPARTPSTARR